MKLLDVWCAYQQEKSLVLAPTTIQHDFRQAGRWLSRCPYQGLTECRMAMTWLLQQEPSKAAARVAQYLKSCLAWAAQEDVGFLPRNPVASFQLPKKPQQDDPRVIPIEVMPVVLEALKASSGNCHSKGARWDLVTDFHLQTGLRPAEGFALTWDDVDWDEKRVKVCKNLTLTHGVRNRTKTGRTRWVPLNGPSMQVLHTLQLLHNETHLFPWPRQSYMSAFRRVMGRLHAAGVIPERYRPYDLRHTQISVALERGIPVTQVASWAGNSPEMCWRHYAGVVGDYELPAI